MSQPRAAALLHLGTFLVAQGLTLLWASLASYLDRHLEHWTWLWGSKHLPFLCCPLEGKSSFGPVLGVLALVSGPLVMLGGGLLNQRISCLIDSNAHACLFTPRQPLRQPLIAGTGETVIMG